MQPCWQRATHLWYILGRAAGPSARLELPGPPQAEHPLCQEGLVATSPTGTAGLCPTPTALGMPYFLSTSGVPQFKTF